MTSHQVDIALEKLIEDGIVVSGKRDNGEVEYRPSAALSPLHIQKLLRRFEEFLHNEGMVVTASQGSVADTFLEYLRIYEGPKLAALIEIYAPGEVN